MSSKHITASKHDPTGPAEIIVRKSVANLKSVPTKQAANLTDKLDRKRRITTAYYRSKRRRFNSGDEIQNWPEAEEEIDGVSQPRKFFPIKKWNCGGSL